MTRRDRTEGFGVAATAATIAALPCHPGWLEEVAVNFDDGNIMVTFGVEDLDGVSDDDLRELCDVFHGYIYPWRRVAS